MLTYHIYGPVAFIWGYHYTRIWRSQSVNKPNIVFLKSHSGGCLNITTPSYQYSYSNYKDKTVVRPSYFLSREYHTWKDRLCIETSTDLPGTDVSYLDDIRSVSRCRWGQFQKQPLRRWCARGWCPLSSLFVPASLWGAEPRRRPGERGGVLKRNQIQLDPVITRSLLTIDALDWYP